MIKEDAIMKTAVVGAGAMGCLFGGLLAESGADVWLLDIRQPHIEEINRHGLCIEADGVSRNVRVRATLNASDIGRADLVIVFVKSHATESAARTAAQLSHANTLALTLQNGLGNAEIIATHLDPRQVIVGTTAHGATLLGNGRIRHAGAGITRIGPFDREMPDRAQKIADFFNFAGIDTEVSDNIAELQWEKLLVNVGINAITALTGIRNGRLPELASARNLCRSAVEEAMSVARRLGIRVREDAVAHVFDIAKATAENRSSMGQDVDARRKTEIEAINGAVIRKARELGISTPINDTLTALVETLQSTF